MFKNILVISTTGIGDTLWGTPAIRALKETYPQIRISVLTSKVGAELLRGNQYISETLVFSKKLPRILSLAMQLRKGFFDTVLIFHASDRIIWPLARLTGACRVIGGDWHMKDKEMSFLLTKTVALPSEKIHAIDARLLLIKELGADTSDKKMDLYLTEEENRWAKTYLTKKGIDDKDFIIGLNPGAAKPYKCWPKEGFANLGKMLSETFNCRIVITGSKTERLLANEIARDIGAAIPTAGDLSIRESAAVIGQCHIFITNDTGPMHIAFALNTPTIALFSATNPAGTGPYHQNELCRVISKPRTCTKCITKKCIRPICMEQIKVEEVFEAVKDLNPKRIGSNMEISENLRKLQA